MRISINWFKGFGINGAEGDLDAQKEPPEGVADNGRFGASSFSGPALADKR